MLINCFVLKGLNQRYYNIRILSIYFPNKETSSSAIVFGALRPNSTINDDNLCVAFVFFIIFSHCIVPHCFYPRCKQIIFVLIDISFSQVTEDGLVQYKYKTSSSQGAVLVPDRIVTDGLWHNISLQLHEKTVFVIVDDQLVQNTFSATPHAILQSDIKMWQLGGAVAAEGTKEFKGCMKDLKINGTNVPLTGPNRFATIVPQGSAITQGCSGSDVCAVKPCRGNPEKPYCLDEWEKYSCISDLPCLPNKCKNNGTCHPTKEGRFHCTCPTNYTGILCETALACLSNTCKEGLVCQGVGSSGYKCVTDTERTTAENDKISIGLIAAIVFLVVLLLGLTVGLLAARRHRLNHKVDNCGSDFDEVAVAIGESKDVSQRTSPSHSSDDSGVVVRNLSSKSAIVQSTLPGGDSEEKNVVVHNVGAPEEYQIKLTRPDDKIDHGFSESDGEYVMKNDFALSGEKKPESASFGKSRHRNSTPHSWNSNQLRPHDPRTRDHRFAYHNPTLIHTRRNYGNQLLRTALDPRMRNLSNSGPGFRHRRKGSLSSEEPPDFSDIDNNSQMLEHYDLDVASIGYSEISYQYDPNTFRDTLARRDLPGFSSAEIERLRQTAPSGSMLDAVSTSSDDAPTINNKMPSFLDPQDTSSESSDDTFTCSEFEYDDPESREETVPGNMVFLQLAPGDADTLERVSKVETLRTEDLNSRRGSIISTMSVSEDEPFITQFSPNTNGSRDPFNWDDVLNWGLRYHNLRGVYSDIAQLKDVTVSTVQEEEYV